MSFHINLFIDYFFGCLFLLIAFLKVSCIDMLIFLLIMFSNKVVLLFICYKSMQQQQQQHEHQMLM